MSRLCRLEVRSSNQKWLLILGLLPTTSCREQRAAAKLAEREGFELTVVIEGQRSPLCSGTVPVAVRAAHMA
jgi:hypothetical protein